MLGLDPGDSPLSVFTLRPQLFLLGTAVLLLALLRLLKRQGVDSRAHTPPLKVVITGSTRGLGLHLACSFLALGDDVVVASRSQPSVEACTARLREEFPGRQVVGIAGDVCKPADVEALGSGAAAAMGRIDIWVCNAGLSASHKAPLAETPALEVAAVVDTNLTGALLCAREAIARMQAQPGGGKLFLVDGSGSNGRPSPGNAAYGATKRALVQLLASLVAETRAAGSVRVHMFSPGMVATDLLLRRADNPRSARMINILAEDPAVVAAWLVPRLRGARGSGRYIRFLTAGGVAWRFLTARARRGRFVPEGGSGAAAGGYARLPAGPAD